MTKTLNIEDATGGRRLLRLQQGDGDVGYCDSACRSSFQLSMVGVAVQHEVGAMTIDNFSQPRGAEAGKYFR